MLNPGQRVVAGDLSDSMNTQARSPRAEAAHTLRYDYNDMAPITNAVRRSRPRVWQADRNKINIASTDLFYYVISPTPVHSRDQS